MIRILNKVSNSQLVRNIIVLSTGTASAQVIVVISSPVITRIYGPEAYGIMGVITSIISIFVPIAALTYPIAIVLPKNEEEAIGLAGISLSVSFIVATITSFVIFFLSPAITSYFNIDESVKGYLYLIPIVVILAAISQIYEQWQIRTKQFRTSAQVMFLQSLIINGSKIWIGLFYPVAQVLLILSAVGPGIRAALTYLFLRRSGKKTPLQLKWSKFNKHLAASYKDFPLFRAPQVLINAIYQNIPALLLSAFFGPTIAGFYILGRSLLRVPSTLIAKSIGDVLYQRIVEANSNKENLTKLILKATIYLFLVGLVPFGIVIIFGPDLFEVIFGAEWKVAGEYARWIALWTFFMFINRPSTRALPVLSAQAFHLKFEILSILVSVLALSIGFYVFNSDRIAIALFCISGAFLNLVLILSTNKISRKHDVESSSS